MKKIAFYKMHGAGNDYVFVDCEKQSVGNMSLLSKRLSDRHFSIGSDGVVFICPSDSCDAKMKMFNSDGSEGKTCGNALRCVGKILSEKRGLLNADNPKEGFPATFTVMTESGAREVTVLSCDGEKAFVSVNMGKIRAEDSFTELHTGDSVVRAILVNAGNPHCVVFCDNPKGIDVGRLGREIETLPVFPDGINVEFVSVPSGVNPAREKLDMRVWERGSGETLACGSGACAAVSAGIENGLIEPFSEVKVNCRGGALFVRQERNGDFILSGEVVTAFKGVFSYENDK